MKFWVLLGLMIAVAFYFYWRLRPYFNTARRVFSVLRDMRRLDPNNPAGAATSATGRTRPAASTKKDRLVRCAQCGAWSPGSRAVTLKPSKTTYCSHACLERATEGHPAANRSVS